MSALQPSEGLLVIGGALGSMAAFNGELYDIRVWNTAGTRGSASFPLRHADGRRARPDGSVQPQRHEPGAAPGAGQPGQPASGHDGRPAPRWWRRCCRSSRCRPVYGPTRFPAKSAAGPLLSPQGLLCTDNATGGTGGAVLRSVELETGQVRWSYDVRPESELTSVYPRGGGTMARRPTPWSSAYKDTTVNFVEIHAVNVATGEPVWQQPPPGARDGLPDPPRGAGRRAVRGSGGPVLRWPGLG